MPSNKEISRTLNLKDLIKKKSHFLLGPRQTGKSTLIRNTLSDVKKYNLLDLRDFQKLSFNPLAIREELEDKDNFIVIDEVQKLPELLNEVHLLIEEKGINFLLTGSSARKLKKYGTNLLGGRARVLNFHPLTIKELGDEFNIEKALNTGMLPSIYFSDEPELDLEAYVGLYVQQEIANESLTRNLPSFARFLEVISLCHGEQLNLSKVSNDAQVPRSTLHDYLEILKDTLVADTLPVWNQTIKRKPIATPKFFFFDWALAKQLGSIGEVRLNSPLAGKAFESLVYQELLASTHYQSLKKLSYWRSGHKDEVDFIYNDLWAIEVKAKREVSVRDAKSLMRLQEEGLLERYIIVYLGDKNKKISAAPGIEVLSLSQLVKGLY